MFTEIQFNLGLYCSGITEIMDGVFYSPEYSDTESPEMIQKKKVIHLTF